jgi:NhaP-type Na+/H+ or K+/H+ antiporter
MIEDVFRVTFKNYFWTPFPFIFLLMTAIFEGCIASRLLKKVTFNYLIVGVIMISNIVGYFVEYFISVALNGGHIMLIWIPWVKIIGKQDLFNYVISFPLILMATLLFEGSINWLLLKRRFTWKQIIKMTALINIVSTIILVILFNGIIFNFIKGEAVGSFIDYLPPIKQ